MFARLVGESFARNPRRKILTAAALVVGMAVATATLSVALDVGDRLAREFRSLGANLLVTSESDTLPLEIGGVDYRPVDEGAYLDEASLGKLKTIFWRHNILGFTPFLDVPVIVSADGSRLHTTLVGTWYEHAVPVPDGTKFNTGAGTTHPWWKVQGRWFHDNSHECVVGIALGATNPSAFAIGETITVAKSEDTTQTQSLVVTGIISTGDAEDRSLVVPLVVAENLSGHPGKIRQLFVSALTKPADSLSERDPKTLSAKDYDRWFCSPYISSISFQIRQVLPGTDVRAIRRVADTEGRILSRIGTLLWIVTLAALAGAALAVAATAATTVLERRDEIGIMKAIGATNSVVGGIFLAEQVLLALVGGTIGFLVGAGLAWILGESVFGAPSSLRLVLLPVVLALASMIAIVGSLVPLWRAANFQPAAILRGE